MNVINGLEFSGGTGGPTSIVRDFFHDWNLKAWRLAGSPDQGYLSPVRRVLGHPLSRRAAGLVPSSGNRLGGGRCCPRLFGEDGGSLEEDGRVHGELVIRHAQA